MAPNDVDLTAVVEGIVHEPTQTAGAGLDLTVDAVARVAAPGRIDFGGGELAAAETEPVETAARNPDDDYGWWRLDAGTYLVTLNESLAAPGDVDPWLQPRAALLDRGATHPTVRVREEIPRVPLTVGGAGLRLKENARISTLTVD